MCLYFNAMRYWVFLFVMLTTLDASAGLDGVEVAAAGVEGTSHSEAVVAEAIKKKIAWINSGGYGYRKDPIFLRAFNEVLVERQDVEAIGRKIEGLCGGRIPHVGSVFCPVHGWNGKDSLGLCGYKKNLAAARALNEMLVATGNSYAIHWKIEGLEMGKYGYAQDLSAARMLNETLVEREDSKAIERKINGLAHGSSGYTKDLDAARAFNETLVAGGNVEAMGRKIEGLADENPDAARTLNEIFIARGDLRAFERKVYGLLDGAYGYEKDLSEVREFIDLLVGDSYSEPIERKLKEYRRVDREFNTALVEEGDERAIRQRVIELEEKDPVLSGELNDVLVERGSLWAIRRKIEGLVSGRHGYNANPASARVFNEMLVGKGNPKAIARKIEGLANGRYGYDRDLDAARALNERLVERGDLHAIERKITGLGAKSEVRFAFMGSHPYFYNPCRYGYKENKAEALRFVKELLSREVCRIRLNKIRACAVEQGIKL